MATIGVSKPYVAKYINTDGEVSYSDGALMAKVTEFSATINTSDDNILYADNAAAESDKSFTGGTITVGVDDISEESSKLILGAKTTSVTIGDKEVSELVYDDDMAAPYLGFGCIIKKRKNGTDKYRAVVFAKVQFAIPADAATTQGETVEWQTSSVEASVMRDDSEKHAWKREATLDSEAEAEAYIKSVLGITEAA